MGDTITAEFDEEENEYYFDAFVEVSGNSTIRLYFEDSRLIDEVREQLNEFGCESELFLQRRIVAINVAKLVSYKEIKSYLDNGEAKSLWDYEESCLAHDYLLFFLLMLVVSKKNTPWLRLPTNHIIILSLS
jgi:Domain of unknown function (DUF4265)